MRSLLSVTYKIKSHRRTKSKINYWGGEFSDRSRISVKTRPVCKLLCFEVSTVSPWGRAISLPPLLSAVCLSASVLLAGFWFSSSLLGQAFHWLCYCLLPLGLLPQYHIPLAGKFQDRLTCCLSVCVCVCVCVHQTGSVTVCVKCTLRKKHICVRLLIGVNESVALLWNDSTLFWDLKWG